MSVIGICFWCGKPKSDITNVRRDEMVLRDYIPCRACNDVMIKGIPVIEISNKPYLGQPPMSDNERIFPTGVWCVVDERRVREILNNDNDMIDKVLSENGMVLLDINKYRSSGLNPKFRELN